MKKLIVSLAALALVMQPVCSKAVEYRMRCLQPLVAGGATYANDINDLGQVVGFGSNSAGGRTAILWNPDGSVVDIGILPGHIEAQANSINNLGQVVGNCRYNSSKQMAFFWNKGIMYELPTLGGTVSRAYAINNNSVIVGESENKDNQMVLPCMWDNTGAHQLQIPSNVGSASDINDNNVIVDRYKGYWDSSGFHSITVGANHLNAINNNGVIVGGGWSSGSSAYSWDATGQKRLARGDMHDHCAYDINDRGQIVGSAITSSFSTHACLWENGVIRDLGTINGYSSFARSINSNGVIAGVLSNSNTTMAVIWEPVPEPSSILAILTGIAGIGGIAIRKRK